MSVRSREGAWKDPLKRRALATADAAALIGAALLIGGAEPGRAIAALEIAASLPLWIVVAKIHGLYDADHTRIRHRTLDEASALFGAVTVSAGATAALAALLPVVPLTAEEALAMWAGALVLTFLMRTAVRVGWRKLTPPEAGLVIGDGQLARAFVRKIALERDHHLVVARRAVPLGPIDPDSLTSTLRHQRIERVILAVEELDEHQLAVIARVCKAEGVKLSVAPPIRSMLGTAVHLNHLAELPLIEYRTWDPSRTTMLAKRVLDICGAGIVLLASSPAMALIALLIRLETPGPALFTQERAGRLGRPFRILKFRTMVAAAEAQLGELVAVDSLDAPMFKVRQDPRVTRVGRVLRRWSIDELPQMINVLRGDMSLCGPRPEETWLVERYGDAARFRLDMRPGMTGPMQVHGRAELDFEERLAIEREYVENYSLRRDLEILIRTPPAVIRGQGAF